MEKRMCYVFDTLSLRYLWIPRQRLLFTECIFITVMSVIEPMC